MFALQFGSLDFNLYDACVETMCKSSLIPTDMELEEVTSGEEETLRPQVRERSASKKNFKKRHTRVSEDSVTAFETEYMRYLLWFSPIVGLFSGFPR